MDVTHLRFVLRLVGVKQRFWMAATQCMSPSRASTGSDLVNVQKIPDSDMEGGY
jgi:hypothetical protein